MDRSWSCSLRASGSVVAILAASKRSQFSHRGQIFPTPPLFLFRGTQSGISFASQTLSFPAPPMRTDNGFLFEAVRPQIGSDCSGESESRAEAASRGLA